MGSKRKKSNINDIIGETFTVGSIYDEIIDNILGKNTSIKPALISEIAIGYLNNQDSVIQAYDEGYYKYYFIRTVKNQVNSTSSPLYKNNVVQERDFDAELLTNEDCDDIQYKIELEAKHELLQEALDNTNVNWFDAELFKYYYVDGLSYRQIEEEYGVDHVLAFVSVKKTKKKIKKYIKNKQNHK